MILVIDIGNTTVGAYAWDDAADIPVSSIKMPSDKFWSASEYLLFMEDSELGGLNYDGAVISSVVPVLTDVLREAARRLTGVEPMVVKLSDIPDMKVLVDEPDRVGMDRLMDAYSARSYALPAVTVDMGTATTVNVIDSDGCFLGGMIAPGVLTGFKALVNGAAQLPPIELTAPADIIGKNTTDCMRSGALYGAAAMVDALTARIEKKLGPVSLIVTGGAAELLHELIEHEHVYDPLLLVKGMVRVYKACDNLLD